MRPFTAVSAAAASLGVLVLTWNAGERSAPLADAPPVASAPGTSSSSPTTSAAPRATAPPGRATAGSSPSAAAPSAAAPSTTASAASGNRDVTGPSIMTRYGAVQVQVKLSGTHITDVVALHLTDSNRTSVQISAQSAPTLRQEALAAQSAQIDVVSGATYTSTGYQQSLQAALDAAHA
ncbi:MAG: FMN-binding protein [Lapillicoccus sp.]